MTDKKEKGTVIKKSTEPRSYVVKTEQSLLRRNRKHLIPTPREETNESTDITASMEPSPDTKPDVIYTRSGRLVTPPDRLTL